MSDDRLRIPLSTLPEFDPVGLWCEHAGSRALLLDVGRDDQVLLAYLSDLDGRPEWVPCGEVWLSTTDASTRDRLARWAVDEAATTAPAYSYSGGGSELFAELFAELADDPAGFVVCLGADAIGASTEVAAEWFDCAHIPQLGGLNPDDPRLLPDGSRWVDAAALADVARHIGSEARAFLLELAALEQAGEGHTAEQPDPEEPGTE